MTQAKSSQKPLVQQHTTPSSITLLYYQTADALYGVNARDGKTVWSTSFDPFGTTVTYNQAVVGDGMVYAESTGSDGYYVYAFDAARGTLRWKFRYGGDELRGEDSDSLSKLLIEQGAVYLVVGTGSLGSVGPYYPQGHTEASPITPTPSILYKMDAISGHILWQHHLDYRLNTPILAYNTLYGIASTVFHGSLEALSGNDGSLLWQHQLPQSDADYGDLLYHDDVLYSMALNVNSTLSLFAFSASNGQSIWQDSEGISGSSISSFATTQNMLYFVTDLHHVYAFDVRDGKLLWQRTYSAFIDSNNLFAFNNTLYLITQSLPDPSPLTLYALNSSSGQQRWIHPLSSQNVTFSQIEARQNVFYVVALNATQGPVTMSKYSSTNGNLMSACTLPSNTTMPTVAGKVTLSK